MKENYSPSYELLKYDFTRDLPARETYFSDSTSFLGEVAFAIGDDYYTHDDFGKWAGDDMRVIEHARLMIAEVGDNSLMQDECRDYREKLIRDYENYFECIYWGKFGDASTLCSFTEYLLAKGLMYDVYRVVRQYFGLIFDEEFDDIVDSHLFSGLMGLFVKAGDVCLYFDHNTDMALRYYELIDNCFSFIYGYTTLSEDFKLPEGVKDIQKNYRFYWKIANLCLMECYNESPPASFSAYNCLCVLLPEKEYIDKICECTDGIFREFNEAKDEERLHGLRFKAFLQVTVSRYFLKYILYKLYRDDEDTRNSLAGAVLERIRYLRGMDQDSLLDYAENIAPGGEQFDNLLGYVSASVIDGFIVRSLTVTAAPKHLVYYTSLKNFSYMLPAECQNDKADRLGRFSLMNISYMNDPEEGMTLIRVVTGDAQESINEPEDEIFCPYVFIKCFSENPDDLSMWELYGDHAEGLCISIDYKRTGVFGDYKSQNSLYRVIYIRRGRDGSVEILPYDNESIDDKKLSDISRWIEELRSIASCHGMDMSLFSDMLWFSRFLIKDRAYAHEKEIRLVVQYLKRTDSIIQSDSFPPLLFVMPDFNPCIDEIIMGPKCDAVHTAPFLKYQLDITAEKLGMDAPVIRKSGIRYR